MQNKLQGRSKMTTKNDATDGTAATDGSVEPTDRGRAAVDEIRGALVRLLYNSKAIDLTNSSGLLDQLIKTAQLPNAADFDAKWAQMEALGYRYGEDALEQVRFGWDLARGATPPAVNYGPPCGRFDPWGCSTDETGAAVDPQSCRVCGFLEPQHHALKTLTAEELLKAQGFDGPRSPDQNQDRCAAGHVLNQTVCTENDGDPCGRIRAAGEPLSDEALAKLHAEICQHASQDWSSPEETFTSQSELRVWDVLSLLNEVVASRAVAMTGDVMTILDAMEGKRPQKTKPITPDEVSPLKQSQIPPEVIEAFNELIVKRWTGEQANFAQRTVLNLILEKLPETTDRTVFENRWLDVEDTFRTAGWIVKYDRPGYCETYEANFTFKRPR